MNTNNTYQNLSFYQRPNKIADIAYQGEIGEVVKYYSQFVEADPQAILLSLMTLLGNTLGREKGIKLNNQHISTNLLTLIIGSTSARKGTAFDISKQIMKDVDVFYCDENIKAGITSGEALIHQVRDQVLDGDKVKDKGSDISEMTLFEAEFAALAVAGSREGSTLFQILRKAYDADPILEALSKGNPSKATNALLSGVFNVTPLELVKVMTQNETEIAGGTVNRMLNIGAHKQEAIKDWDEFDANKAKLLCLPLIKALNNNAKRVEWGEGSFKIWKELYKKISEGILPIEQKLLGRVTTNLLKIASIFAIFENDYILTETQLLQAWAIIDHHTQMTKFIYAAMLDTKLMNDVIHLINTNDEMGFEDIIQSLNTPHYIIRAILTELVFDGRLIFDEKTQMFSSKTNQQNLKQIEKVLDEEYDDPTIQEFLEI